MSTLLEDAKELRKLRKRPNGVSAIGLALGKKLSNVEELIADDPFKLKTGGFIDMKSLNRRGKMKYIEEELGKRKGISISSAKKEALTPFICLRM